MQVTIAGSGGWGTALAILLHENGHDVTLWSHFETESKQLAETHQNPYLPGVTLPEGLHYSADPACAQGREMVVFATPSFAVRTTARAFAPYLAETPLLVSVTKGIEEGTGYRMSELVSQETGRTVVALSGPSHAEEVSRGIPTGVVVACPERELAERVQNAFMCSRFRVYTSPDTAGIELGAALKNVIALCAGVCDGMGYGDNTKALLMTRGLAEVARLGMALGAHRETFAGLAGVGDLIVTCTSMHSRNRRAGILIGQGVPVQEAMKQVGAVVEGYYAAQSAWELAQRPMPCSMKATIRVRHSIRSCCATAPRRQRTPHGHGEPPCRAAAFAEVHSVLSLGRAHPDRRVRPVQRRHPPARMAGLSHRAGALRALELHAEPALYVPLRRKRAARHGACRAVLPCLYALHHLAGALAHRREALERLPGHGAQHGAEPRVRVPL